MTGQVHPALGNGDALALEQTALKRCMRLANENPAAGPYHSMPGDSLTGGTCGHGTAGGACPPAQAQGLGYPSVGEHATARDSSHVVVNGFPRHRIHGSSAPHDRRPVLCAQVAAMLPGHARNLRQTWCFRTGEKRALKAGALWVPKAVHLLSGLLRRLPGALFSVPVLSLCTILKHRLTG